MIVTIEWKPIETAPKTGFKSLWPGKERGPVIMLANKGGCIEIGFWNGRSWDDGDWRDDMGDFDWWAELPKVPE